MYLYESFCKAALDFNRKLLKIPRPPIMYQVTFSPDFDWMELFPVAVVQWGRGEKTSPNRKLTKIANADSFLICV